jgi:hypothetical protein
MAETMRPELPRYWVRTTKANGEQTLWCVNTGKAKALSIYDRECRKAEAGDEIEWGRAGDVVSVSCIKGSK